MVHPQKQICLYSEDWTMRPNKLHLNQTHFGSDHQSSVYSTILLAAKS